MSGEGKRKKSGVGELRAFNACGSVVDSDTVSDDAFRFCVVQLQHSFTHTLLRACLPHATCGSVRKTKGLFNETTLPPAVSFASQFSIPLLKPRHWGTSLRGGTLLVMYRV